MSDAVQVAIISGIFTLIPTLLAIYQSAKKSRKEVNDKIDALDKKLGNHIKEDEWGTMRQTRARILRFANDICKGDKFSEEYWTNILDDIDDYEQYCKTHSDFRNNKGVLAMKFIKEEYVEANKSSYFISQKEK